MLLSPSSCSKGAPGLVLKVKAFAGLGMGVIFLPRFVRAKHVWATEQMLEEGTNEKHLEVTHTGRVCALTRQKAQNLSIECQRRRTRLSGFIRYWHSHVWGLLL